MSVANVSDASQGLAQYFQRLAANSAQTSGTPAPGTPDPSSSTAQGAQAGQDGQAAHAHHHHGGGAIRGKIESAVTSALQNYDGTGDVNQVIQNAIKSAVASGNPSASVSGNPSAPASADATSASTSAQSSDAFQQLLQSKGVDASQFRDDIFAAFKSANGTDPASSGALSALPPGSYVDAEG